MTVAKRIVKLWAVSFVQALFSFSLRLAALRQSAAVI
jgi:hypothetical protein